MDKLIVNLSEYIRNAYYSMPVFTNADDRVVSGAYGALFKIINSARNENAELIEIVFPADMSDNSSTNNNALADQTVLLTDSIREAIGEAVTDMESGFSFSVNDNVLNALSDKLAALSPTGQVKAAPSFNLSMRSTSDLGEVDELFRKASDCGPGDKNNYVAFYILTDTVNKDDTKYKEILGMSVCFNENEAIYIPVENFITADYLGKKLSELSNSVSLVTFDIKESYRVFTPFEVSDRDYGYSCKGEHTED